VSGAAFRALARRAAARYPAGDRYARHFAYGKLTRDPAFAWLLASEHIPAGARLLDIGCGQGLLGALLAADERAVRYRGIDLGARDIERARAAAPPGSELMAGDMRTAEFGRADVVVLLDVLHYVRPDQQALVLRKARDALAGGGALLMRVADASAGIRFRITTAIDLAATNLRGRRVARLHHVQLPERRRALEQMGFRVEAVPMSEGTPFANVLLCARYDSRAT
jgi:SAM-dependent methyltransferase